MCVCVCVCLFLTSNLLFEAFMTISLSQTRLSDFTFTSHFHALEEEMATHSSVLAWRIPGTVGPGGLLSMGSHSRTRLKRLSSSSSRGTRTGLVTVNEERCFPQMKTLWIVKSSWGFNDSGSQGQRHGSASLWLSSEINIFLLGCIWS